MVASSDVISPAELSFRLETFEGPLDLLLSLIEKHKIDICDIRISLLLEQYMAYMDAAAENNISLTADFLEMAATLVYIKSRSLLPRDEEEQEDPKLLLEQRLQEYARCKKAAAELSEKCLFGKIFFRDQTDDTLPKAKPELSEYCADRVAGAYREVIRRMNGKKPLSPKNFDGIIGTRFISVGSKVISILRILVRRARTSFREIFRKGSDRSEIVATFLAVLELIRGGRVDVRENDGDVSLTLVDSRHRIGRNSTDNDA